MCMCDSFRRGFGRLTTILKNSATLLLLLWQSWKEVNDVAMVYATLIIKVKGRWTFESVPATLKEQVREILIACDCGYLCGEEAHE